MVEGEGDWNARPHGGAKRRVWRKVHLGTDEQTLEIRAVVVTSSDVGDAPMLLELLAQIHADQDIASVTAPSHGLQANRCRGHGRCLRHPKGPRCDRRTGCRRNHHAPQERQTMEDCHSRCHRAHRSPEGLERSGPRALAPPSTASCGCACRAMDGAATTAGAASRPSASCKPKVRKAHLLGQRLAAREFDRQVAEFQVRVAVLNSFTALGTPVTRVVG